MLPKLHQPPSRPFLFLHCFHHDRGRAGDRRGVNQGRTWKRDKVVRWKNIASWIGYKDHTVAGKPGFLFFLHQRVRINQIVKIENSWQVKKMNWCHEIGLDSRASFGKPRSSPSKNEPLSQEMHLKIPLLSQGLKLSNSKPGCRVSALHFFVK